MGEGRRDKNLYQFLLNDTIRLRDPLGLTAENGCCTQEAIDKAADEAIRTFRVLSKQDTDDLEGLSSGYEYCGLLCCIGDGIVTYTGHIGYKVFSTTKLGRRIPENKCDPKSIRDDMELENGVEFALGKRNYRKMDCEKGGKIVGDWHVHPFHAIVMPDLEPSPKDREHAKKLKEKSECKGMPYCCYVGKLGKPTCRYTENPGDDVDILPVNPGDGSNEQSD